MSGSKSAVTRSTAAVFVDGRRAGSAVLIGSRYLLTAAHVLLHRDPGTGVKVPVDRVGLEFPGRQLGRQSDRVVASRLDLGPTSAGVDVAVLDLGEDPPDWLPAPVPIWPSARPPRRVEVFGYPLAEGLLNGVWRQFAVAGPATAGTVQLDWSGDVGAFPGHSGGPVIDADRFALAGVLVEGSDLGRFDRFLPVKVIARVWTGLPRPWLTAGGEPGEARSHFARRARGQRSAARGGDLFRGRTVALDRIQGWLTADEPPGQTLVLIGQPGAGKSAVLARAALSVETNHGGPGLAFHARSATVGDFLTALANLTGVDAPASAEDLITSLADLPGQPPTRVVVDALDEAASDLDRRQISQTLAELSVLPGLRVAVATRPLAVGNPFAQGRLLSVLGVTGRDARNLIDLDGDTYFDPDGLHRFAAALLAQDGMEHPGPADGAWTQYRIKKAVCERLAAIIAERAGRNFLIAALAADLLSRAPGMIDPTATGFDPGDIPSGVGEALNKYFDRLPEHQRERGRALFTALAYARGAGLNDSTWLAFAAALGYGDVTTTDLDVLRHSPSADYLLQTAMIERGTPPATRLFHQALADELLSERHQPSDEAALLDILLAEGGSTAWEALYPREHVAEHATAAARLDRLLRDPHYLLAVDPRRLVPHLDAAGSATARVTAAVYRQSAHYLGERDHAARASQLELTAHRLGYQGLAARIAGAAEDRQWQTLWSSGRPDTDHQAFTGHIGAVTAMAVGELPDGTRVVMSGGKDATVRLWQLTDGAPVGKPLIGHADRVIAIAAGMLPDGTPVIVSGSRDATVRVWRIADGVPLCEPLTGHRGWVTSLAVSTLPDGTPVIVSGSSDATVRVWRLIDGTPLARLEDPQWHGIEDPLTAGGALLTTDWINAVATGALTDGTPVIVGGSYNSTVRVWRLSDGALLTDRPFAHDRVLTVAAGVLPDHTPVIISGGDDAKVRVWRLADGTPLGEPLTGHTGSVAAAAASVDAVAAAELPDGTPIAISGGRDATVRVWRLADGAPLGEPLTGHTDWVTSVAASTLPDGTPVIVSSSLDATIRVWRIRDAQRLGHPLPGHTKQVNTVAAGAMPDGTPVAISGSHDSTMRVRRLADGTPLGEPLTHHTDLVQAVAVAALPDGTPVIISASSDATVRVSRLADGAPLAGPLTGHTDWVTSVAASILPDGTPVIISGSLDSTVRVWRLADGALLAGPLTGHTGSVDAVAASTLPNGTPVIISASSHLARSATRRDAAIRVWRLADGAPLGEPLTGHTDWVTSVAASILPDGTPVIISGSRDATVRVWRLADGTPLGEPLTGHTDWVTSVAASTLPDGTPVIISGSRDTTVRVWRLADGTPLVPPLAIGAWVRTIATYGNFVVTGFGADIAAHRLTFHGPVV